MFDGSLEKGLARAHKGEKRQKCWVGKAQEKGCFKKEDVANDNQCC